jgi:pilus assembly protein CpaE
MAEKKALKRILLVSRDRTLLRDTRAAFSASEGVELETVELAMSELRGEVQQSARDALILDMNASSLDEMEALQRIMRRLEGQVPVLVVTHEIDPAAARILIQLQVTDLLVKPISTSDLVRACLRALQGPNRVEGGESTVHTFLPAAGGVGNTTLALATAFQLHNSVARGASTCVVDLNLQQGSCAEYLDLEPRFDIAEIENQPERLDRQLLDVMLSKHESGLCVLAAPNSPTEMRTFDTSVVVRMLDLVSAYFDNVVIDLPQTWFPWTQTVLLGTNRLFVVSEMTVPCLRQAHRLMASIRTISAGAVSPSVIVNRFEKRGADGGVRTEDIKEMLGERFAGGVANNYRLVREAVDRGVPVHEIDPKANVIDDLRRILFPHEAALGSVRGRSLMAMASGLFRRAG